MVNLLFMYDASNPIMYYLNTKPFRERALNRSIDGSGSLTNLSHVDNVILS